MDLLRTHIVIYLNQKQMAWNRYWGESEAEKTECIIQRLESHRKIYFDISERQRWVEKRCKYTRRTQDIM